MENKKDKKRKLTLSPGSTTRSPTNIEFTKGRNKTSVVIEKKNVRRGNFKSIHNANKSSKTSLRKGEDLFTKDRFRSSNQKTKSSFKKRKLAEQSATDRFKTYENKSDLSSPKLKSSDKSKKTSQKREYKLTLSRALNEDDPGYKERSLASVRRARLKEKKNLSNENSSFPKKVVKDVHIPNVITIQELANRMAERATDLIKHLMSMGVVATINHTIDADTAEYLVKEFNHKGIRETNPNLKFEKIEDEKSKNLIRRSPVVTVMGHVDHGKTSLLDALRQANVVADEHGGITQHIGAYQVDDKNNKSITFIDTPGHSAFTEMRARGSKVTDIVVLVVAADDGVKPQTVEAINHSKAANVPIVVAINKCDLPGADPSKIKNQLLEHELIAEELSGDTLFVEVSAKTKNNLDKLKDTINLQAEILELKANPNSKAKGVILESRIDKGKGPVSTVLVMDGTLKTGDYFVSGCSWGKIRAMINCMDKTIDSADPSTPIEILGMNSSALAGDDFFVVDSESEAKEINKYRLDKTNKNKNPLILATQENVFQDTKKIKELPIIIKSDVHGSSEALKNAIEKIKHTEVKPKIILSSIGLITETDITLAKASDGIIIGFNVKPSKEAKKLAENLKIKINFFNIIYEAMDYISSALSGLLDPTKKEEVVGSAEILQIFKVSKVGKVAGSKVVNGEINNNSKVRLIRDGKVMYTGSVNSIFREKNSAKNVSTGLECGITLKDFTDFKAKDVIEAYKVVEIERSINEKTN